MRTYVTGFITSVLLTLLAYVVVVDSLYSKWTLAIILVGLAIVQFIVQLVYFMHLGREAKPRWMLATLLVMILILGIIVIGSLWIMHNLDYHMNLTPTQIDNYMKSQQGI